MSYSMPIPLVYTNSTVVDFGDSPTSWSFKGPSGKQGMLKNIGIHVTEVFSGDQVTGKVLVGTTADPNYYGQLEIADGTAATDTYNDQDDSDCVIIEALAADTQIEVSFTAVNDAGTDTGQGFVYFETFWY
jgi:hypothetical protein